MNSLRVFLIILSMCSNITFLNNAYSAEPTSIKQEYFPDRIKTVSDIPKIPKQADVASIPKLTDLPPMPPPLSQDLLIPLHKSTIEQHRKLINNYTIKLKNADGTEYINSQFVVTGDSQPSLKIRKYISKDNKVNLIFLDITRLFDSPIDHIYFRISAIDQITRNKEHFRPQDFDIEYTTTAPTTCVPLEGTIGNIIFKIQNSNKHC